MSIEVIVGLVFVCLVLLGTLCAIAPAMLSSEITQHDEAHSPVEEETWHS